MTDPTPKPLSREERDRWSEWHHEVKLASESICGECSATWPCSTTRLLTALDRAEEREGKWRRLSTLYRMAMSSGEWNKTLDNELGDLRRALGLGDGG